MTSNFFRNHYVPIETQRRMHGLLTDFKKKMQQTELHPRHLIQIQVSVNYLLLNVTDTINVGTIMHSHDQKRKTLAQDYLRHLCVSSLSNRRRSMATHRWWWHTHRSTRWGIRKSLVKIAFLRAGRGEIQPRVSAPFSQLTGNSVMASSSKLPNTLKAVHCKQRLNKRRSKLG